MTKVGNAPTAANVTLDDNKIAPAEQANAQATLHYDNEKTNVADSPMNINTKMSRNISETANDMNVTSDNIQMTQMGNGNGVDTESGLQTEMPIDD